MELKFEESATSAGINCINSNQIKSDTDNNDYSHCIVFIDAQNADLEIRDIKKEADKLSVSRSAQRLFSGNSGLEQEARSHVRQLKDTILAELVNINDDTKMSYGDYIRAINESDRWNTII